MHVQGALGARQLCSYCYLHGVGGTLTSSANLTVTWPSQPTTTSYQHNYYAANCASYKIIAWHISASHCLSWRPWRDSCGRSALS